MTLQPFDITAAHNFLLADGVFVHNSIDGDAPAAMRYCVTGDTRVWTPAGSVPIAEIVPGAAEHTTAPTRPLPRIPTAVRPERFPSLSGPRIRPSPPSRAQHFSTFRPPDPVIIRPGTW